MDGVNTEPSERVALLIDLERCTGCKSCEAACKTEHRLGPGEYRNKVVWASALEEAGLAFLTLTCQHCERPACLRVCPVNPKAIAKDPVTGIVRIDESRCTGCGECVIACPYSAMGYDAKGHHAVKCDLCTDVCRATRIIFCSDRRLFIWSALPRATRRHPRRSRRRVRILMSRAVPHSWTGWRRRLRCRRKSLRFPMAKRVLTRRRIVSCLVAAISVSTAAQ